MTPQKIDDGGPAFPNPTWAQGMSTRMWLAGMAMQGILACEQVHPNIKQTSNEDLAECACEIADAMIAASRKDAPQ